ncbi:MAG: response regulator [Pseudodesulfovibrio sp.]|uniref:response regulator n=1 Tax=Pseudodesulfovibrio sp. TaxID=2035812 RepID=UPI003D0B10A0
MIDVIIVEDDPMVAAINSEYLSRLEGFNLRGHFGTAKACLEYLDRQEQTLVLLDVFMPGLDGLELLQHIRNTYTRVDVIMITADRSSNDIKKALRLGVIDYLMKPFTFERFQVALLSYQERRRLLESHAELDQSILDKRIFIREKPSYPKGVDAETLQNIQNSLSSRTESCSMKDLEQDIGLSRVSIKKYLVYLEEIGKVASHLDYPAIGRPLRKYRWL